MSEPRVCVTVHCTAHDFAPVAQIIPPNGWMPEHVICVQLGEASIHLSQYQAADLSLTLTRAISDVDRAKAAPVVAQAEQKRPYLVYVMDLARGAFATFHEALAEAKRLQDVGVRNVSIVNQDRADGSADGPYGEMRYHDGLTQDERDALSEVM